VAQSLLDAVRTHAAVLLRGLHLPDARAVAALGDRLLAGLPAFATGEHPRAQGANSVYRPVRYAPEETLLWHHENSFNSTWPLIIMFTSTAPALEGGATTLVDGRLVYAQVPERIRAAFAARGIRYQRSVGAVTGRTWQQLYRTTNPAEARRAAAEGGEELEITADGARISALRPAFLQVEHGTSWFNQVLHWHARALPRELRQLISDGLLAPPRSCTLGDGEPIEDATVELLIEAHEDLEYPVQWRHGDVLLFDNEVMAHGRRPYRGPREHYVRMAGIGQHPHAAYPPPTGSVLAPPP
jgi:hypothetical protein